MRPHILAAFLLVCAPGAFAQQVIAPPAEAAPAATSPIEERTEWCDAYATWLIAMTPAPRGAAPADVRQSQHLEVELNACKIDPQQYERQTRAEADYAVEVAQG
ncbi:MAG: hypothetical protein R3C30_13940 [Hyphomonadaceae bacterium]